MKKRKRKDKKKPLKFLQEMSTLILYKLIPLKINPKKSYEKPQILAPNYPLKSLLLYSNFRKSS